MSMPTTCESDKLNTDDQWKHIGESQGCANHDHDLIHELSRRLDSLWRYDQFIANAESRPAVQACWRHLKQQEAQNIEKLKALVTDEVKQGCF